MVARKAETVTVALSGEYDLSNRDDIIAAFLPANMATTTIVDLTNASYLDSCFLLALLDFSEKMTLSQGHSDVRLAGASRHLSRVFFATGFDRMFHMYASVDEALAADA